MKTRKTENVTNERMATVDAIVLIVSYLSASTRAVKSSEIYKSKWENDKII